MKGILTKEKYVIWHTCSLYLIIPLFFYVIMIVTLFIRKTTLDGFPIGMVYIFMGIIPITTTNADIQSRWSTSCLTMPYSRSQIVSAKYICALILTAGVTVSWLMMIFICRMLGADITANTILSLTFTGTAFGLMPAAIFLPLSFKWYNTTGGKRIVLGGIMGGVVGGANSYIMSHVPGAKGSAIFMGMMTAAFFISWLISVKIFERKDV